MRPKNLNGTGSKILNSNITVYIPLRLRIRLSKLIKKSGKTKSKYVQFIIESWVEEQEWLNEIK